MCHVIETAQNRNETPVVAFFFQTIVHHKTRGIWIAEMTVQVFEK
jgi:hypothetical protein